MRKLLSVLLITVLMVVSVVSCNRIEECNCIPCNHTEETTTIDTARYEDREPNLGKNMSLVITDVSIIKNWDDSKDLLLVTIEFSHSFCCERYFMQVVSNNAKQNNVNCVRSIPALMKWEEQVETNITKKAEPTEIVEVNLLYEVTSITDVIELRFTDLTSMNKSLVYIFDPVTGALEER